mgnify:FL=1
MAHDAPLNLVRINRMKKQYQILLAIIFVFNSNVLAENHNDSQSDKDVREVEQLIYEIFANQKKNLSMDNGTFSKKGVLAFFSSGGLMQELSPEVKKRIFESFAVKPKHVHCISLVAGSAVAAMFYVEGSEQFKGQALVPNKLCRVTQVFVKEGGAWKVRVTHWSPIIGGQGTTSTSVND